MSKNLRQLGFCLLALAALAVFAAPAAQAIPFSYTESGVGPTMDKACANAVQNIKDNCDIYGPITTDPGRCWPLWDINEEFIIGYVCTCEATTSACGNFIGLP